MKAFLISWMESYRGLVVAALALGLAWLLYPRPRQAARKEGTTEIVFWLPRAANDAMKSAVEEFERRHPQYRVIVGTATVRDAVGDPTRFLLGVAGGVPPDLIYFDRFAVVEWASRGAFTDLNPFLARDRNGPDGIREENYIRPAWLEPVYKGKTYAIANSIDTRALYYNSEALVRAGLVYQEGEEEGERGTARPPKTWEEVCRKKLHALGKASPAGRIKLSAWVRRPAVNEQVPRSQPVELGRRNIRPGDVAVLIAQGEVFRARISRVSGPRQFQVDLKKELPPGTSAIPFPFLSGPCEVKVFGGDSYIVKLTRFDRDTGEMKAAGFIPLHGNSWLYMFGWLNGAKFMAGDGEQCLLDSSEVIEALQYMTDCYDALGGVEKANLFRASVLSGALDPFLTGKIAMLIQGNWFLGTISAFKPDLDFGVVPSPIPEKRMAAGFPSYGWLGGWSYAIPTGAKQKDAAWELLKWLSSVEANQLMAELSASLQRAQGQAFFPMLHPDVRVMRWLDERFLAHDPGISDRLKRAYRTFVKLTPTSKYRPVTPVGQKLWNEHARATEAALNHTKMPYDALNYGKRQVQISLDRHLHPPEGKPVPWGGILSGYGVLLISGFALLIWREERRRKQYGGVRGAWVGGYVCASPWLLGFVVFGGGPILFSLIISFCHYDVLNPARFIGWTNYVNLMGRHFDEVVHRHVWNDPLLWKGLANTGFMVLGVPLGIAAGLALALLLDSGVRGLHIYRTIYYLPAIVPAVASFILWIWIFDPSRGLLNQMLKLAGIHSPPLWLQDPLWAKPSIILMGLWGVGGGMIIWLAGLKDIPESLYEAAAIDGANRWQRFRHITIPMLSPYIFFNLIMGMIGVFQIFEAAYIMTDGGPADSTLFFAYKLFNEAFRFLNMGTASAMAWILFMVVLAITLFQLWLSKKWVHYER